MNFNINTVLADMLSAIKGTFSDNWKNVEPVAMQFIKCRKDRLELLSDLYLSGDISPQKFESRLEDEKTILEAELEAIKVVTKAFAQKAANAAFDVLANAVKNVVKTVI